MLGTHEDGKTDIKGITQSMRPSAWHGYTKALVVKVNKAVLVSHVSSTTLVGQNGGVVKQTAKIAVTGCPTEKPFAKPKPDRRRARDRWIAARLLPI